ncbi:ImmA/IrrE family metallo-endopeptidase [Clostridioides difficile]|nr:ImmA/IrrE family metallo-endopeptidase [Clostridioides difficile]
MNISEVVRGLIEKCKTRNPFDIIECLGVVLVFFPLDGVNGFYQHFQRCDIIYVDERLTELQKMLVCAHELGHMIMHKKTNAVFMDTRTNFCTSKYELEADRFAVDLLISDDEIEEHLDYTTAQLSRLFGYKKKLIELRLKDFI